MTDTTHARFPTTVQFFVAESGRALLPAEKPLIAFVISAVFGLNDWMARPEHVISCVTRQTQPCRGVETSTMNLSLAFGPAANLDLYGRGACCYKTGPWLKASGIVIVRFSNTPITKSWTHGRMRIGGLK